MTLNDEPSHADKKRRDLEKRIEETGHSMKVGVMGLHLGKRRTASARDADDKTMRPTTADTLVAHDERDKRYPAESGSGLTIGGTGDTSGPPLETQEHKITSSSLGRFPPQNQEGLSRKILQTPDNTVDLNLDSDYPVHLYDDSDSDDGNNNADNEILEVPRGRKGRLAMSRNGLPSGSSTPSPTISPRSSILYPISPSLNIPLSHPPNSQSGSHSRPRTAPTATTTIFSSPLASSSAPASRPGTGDSTGPIRHHRLDSIRGTTIPHGHVQGHRTPPTRDSSPSRSVRFVDNVGGESGQIGNGNDSEGRKMTVVDIRPPLPSRSSSFYRNGNVEGEEPAVSTFGSVATTVASRPPTR